MILYYMYIFRIISFRMAAFTGWETKNRYSVTDIRGEPVFYVAEESNICWRLCLGKYRSCEFSIFDRDRREVLHMIRPFRCDSCCCPRYLQVAYLNFLYCVYYDCYFCREYSEKNN